MRKTNNKTAKSPGHMVCLAMWVFFLLPLRSLAEPARVLKAGR